MTKVTCDMCGKELDEHQRIKLTFESDPDLVWDSRRYETRDICRDCRIKIFAFIDKEGRK